MGRPFSQHVVVLAEGGAPLPVAPPPLPGETAPAVTPPPELAPAPRGGDVAVVGCPATSNCQYIHSVSQKPLYSEHHRMQSHKYLLYSRSGLYMLQILIIQMYRVCMHWVSGHGTVSNMHKLCAVSALKLSYLCWNFTPPVPVHPIETEVQFYNNIAQWTSLSRSINYTASKTFIRQRSIIYLLNNDSVKMK